MTQTEQLGSGILLGVRHGRVENRTDTYFGILPGFHLSDLGRVQAQTVGKALKGNPVSAIYSSPLERAVEMAQIIGREVQAEVIVDDRLIEWRFWETIQGRNPSDELSLEIQGVRKKLLANPDDATRVESFNQLRQRLRSWMEEVKGAQHEELALVVGHTDALRTLLLDLVGDGFEQLWDVQLDYGDVIRLTPNPLPRAFEGKSAGHLLTNGAR